MGKLILPRRKFLLAGAGLLAAPAIVRAGQLSLLGAGKVGGGGGGGNVTFDAASTVQTGSGTSISWTHTPVGTPSKVALVVFAFDGTGTGTATATYNGVTMGDLIRAGDTNLVGAYMYIFGLASPAASPQSAQVNFSGSVTNIIAASISVTGGDLATCFDQKVTTGTSGTSGTDSSITATAVASGDLLLDFACFEGGNDTMSNVSGPQTSIFTNAANGVFRASAGRTAGAGANITPTWHYNATQPWIALAASFKK